MRDTSYENSERKSSGGPTAYVARKLRRGTDSETALRSIVGSDRAREVVRAVCSAKLREVRAPREALIRITRKGRPHHFARPGTARVQLSRAPVHDANKLHVRRAVLMLVHILGWLGPAGRTGHKGQGARLRVDMLAERCALRERPLDRKEVQRYLAVFRSAGILRAWQPPAYDENGVRNDLPVGPSGHCFNFYELAWDEMPAELERALASFHRRWWPRRARVAALAPAMPRGVELDGAAIAAALRARASPS